MKKQLNASDARALQILRGKIRHWMEKRGRILPQELSPGEKEELKQCFDLMDTDKSGAIDADELHEAFRVLGEPITYREAVALIRAWDDDDSGEIEYPEFEQIMTQRIDQEKIDKSNQAAKQPIAFHLFALTYCTKRLLASIVGGEPVETRAIIKSILTRLQAEGHSTKDRRKSKRQQSIFSAAVAATKAAKQKFIPFQRKSSAQYRIR